MKTRDDGHSSDKDLSCPNQARFMRCAPDQDNQTKNQCMLCNAFVKGGFPMRAMHLMGNFGKDSTSGCGYTGQTRPRCKFFGSPSIFASKDHCITTSSASSSSFVRYAHDLRYF